MQEIVFDDACTPHFRLRDEMTEDKTLEEAARKPMTMMTDISELSDHHNGMLAAINKH